MEFPDQEPLISYHHSIRSRYGETDKMGYVYYGRYLDYFEEARTELIRDLGLPYSHLEKEGVLLPVIHAELDYNRPVGYDELMDIEVLIYELPVIKLYTYYRVTTEESDFTHVEGKVTLCFLNKKDRRPRKAPQIFIDALEEPTDYLLKKS